MSQKLNVIVVLGVVGVLFGLTAFAQDSGLDRVCLGCICEVTSGCNTTAACRGDVCGPFSITWAYWADSGKPTLNGEDSGSQTAFSNCVNDVTCAASSVQGYMAKFGKDCDGDGAITCLDYLAIHLQGGYGCNGAIPPPKENIYRQCLEQASQLTG